MPGASTNGDGGDSAVDADVPDFSALPEDAHLAASTDGPNPSITDECGNAMPTTDVRKSSSVVEGGNATCNSGGELIVDALYTLCF